MIAIFAGCLFLAVISSANGYDSNEKNLYNTKLSVSSGTIGHNVDLRPVTRYSDVVNVTFRLTLIRITDVDESAGTMEGLYWPALTWKDPSFIWNSEDYANIKYLKIPVSRIWQPDIVHLHSARNSEGADVSNIVEVDHNGTVSHSTRSVLRSSCDSRRGEWECKLKFGSWGYTTKELDIELDGKPEVELKYYEKGGKWQIVRTSATKSTPVYHNSNYAEVEYTIVLQQA